MADVLTCPNPEIIDPLQLTGYSMTITAFPGMTLWFKDANIPSINLGEANQATRFVDFAHPGDKLQYGTLDCRIMVDAKMHNYRQLYQWISLLGFPNNTNEVDIWRRLNKGRYPKFFRGHDDNDYSLYSDAFIQVNGANQKGVAIFHFLDMFPVSLGGIQLNDEQQETQYVYVDASFKFRTFEMIMPEEFDEEEEEDEYEGR